jgi:hypothetical protein
MRGGSLIYGAGQAKLDLNDNTNLIGNSNPNGSGGAIYLNNSQFFTDGAVFSGNDARDGGALSVNDSSGDQANEVIKMLYDTSDYPIDPPANAFSYGIYDRSGNLIIPGTVNAVGRVLFNTYSFKTPGTYHYIMKEVTGGTGRILFNT